MAGGQLQHPRRYSTLAAAVTIVLCAVVLAYGYRFAVDRAARSTSQVEGELTAISSLKSQQIESWRKERISNVTLLSTSVPILDAAERWLVEGDPDGRAFVTDRLEALIEGAGAVGGMIVDSEGRILLETEGYDPEVHVPVSGTIEDVLRSGEARIADMRFVSGEPAPCVCAAAPLISLSDGTTLGAVVIRSDAGKELIPAIAEWPLPSESGESLVIVRDGDAGLILGADGAEQAHSVSHVSLEDGDSVEVRAALGEAGVLRGRDRDGQEVVAVSTAIPGSGWRLLTKVDEAEAFAAWHTERLLLFVLAAGLIVGVGAAVSLLWQRTHANRLASLLENESRYRATLMSIADGVLAVDAENRIVFMNDAAALLTGWPDEEARGHVLSEVVHLVDERTHERLECTGALSLCGQDGQRVDGLLLVARDGTERTIAVGSSSVLSPDGAGTTGSVLVLQDQTAEQAARREVQRQRDRLEEAEQHAGIASWEYDLRTGVGWWSPQLYRMFSLEPSGVAPTFEEHLELVHPADKHVVEQVVSHIAAGEVPPQIEHRIRPVAGVERTLSSMTYLVRDDDGTPVRYTGTVLDITEQKRAAQDLERFKFMVENATQEVYLTNAEGRIEYLNKAAAASVGYSVDELLGEEISVVSPHIQPPFPEHVDFLRETGFPRVEGVHIAKDGSEVRKEIRPFYLQVGGEEYVCAFAQDITERKAAEEELRESRRMLRLILDTIPVRVFWKDRDLRYLGCNQPFAEDAGFGSPEEVVGKDDFSMGWTEQAELYRADHMAVIESGRPRLGYEEPQTTPDGRSIWLRTSKVPLPGPEGEIIGVMGTYEEITALKEANEALRELNRSLEGMVRQRTEELEAKNDELRRIATELVAVNEELVDAGEAKSRFLRSMSHELRTPLNSIIGFSGVMLQGMAGAVTVEQRTQLEMILRSGKHLLELVNDILDLSRIEAGRIDIVSEPIDARALCAEVISSVRASADEKGLELVTEMSDEHLSFDSDHRKVRQVLINLLGNAVKFTEKGQVVLTVDRPGSAMVSFTVRDSGPGISAEEQQMIFGEFVQGSTGAAAAEREGTGLGLAISQRIAVALGGTLTVVSEPGEGSAFTLLLPDLSTAEPC